MSESWSARTVNMNGRTVSMSQAANAARSLRLAHLLTDPNDRAQALRQHFGAYLPPSSGPCQTRRD